MPAVDMTAPGTMEQALGPTADPAWVFHAHGYDSLREGSIESRFAISNGFLGVRAALAVSRGARWVVPPRTYVAGLFDTPVPMDLYPNLCQPPTGCGSASCCPAGLWCTTLARWRRSA